MYTAITIAIYHTIHVYFLMVITIYPDSSLPYTTKSTLSLLSPKTNDTYHIAS